MTATLSSAHPQASALADVSLLEIIRRNKGWTLDYFRDQVHAPSALPPLDGILEAADRLLTAAQRGEQVTILTDFDMDGIAAGVIAYAGLSELGVPTNLAIPDYRGARDITADQVDRALAQFPDTAVFITCDVGISSGEGIRHAQEHGVEVIVTDHHLESPENICPAEIVINPNRVGSTYPEKHICGAQVMHLLLIEQARRHAPHKIGAMSMLALFAGVGALADVMPLTGTTRDLVRRALALLRLSVPDMPGNRWGGWDKGVAHQADTSSATLMQIIGGGQHHPRYVAAFDGMARLITALVGAGKLRSVDDVNASFIGFTLAPTFNATRRVNGDMHDSFQIFTPDAVARACPGHHQDRDTSIATVLSNNEHRKALTIQALQELHSTPQPYAPYVWRVDAPAGILGLLAGRLSGDSGLPTVVLDADTLRGSARAPEWAGVIDIITALGDPGLHAAGHQQACGVFARDEASLQRLAQALHEVAETTSITPARADLQLIDLDRPDLITDLAMLAELDRPDLRPVETGALITLVSQLSSLEPFGHGFDYPDIRVTFRPQECLISRMGTSQQHLKIVTPSGLSLLWWNKAEVYDGLLEAQSLTAIVELGTNDFRGEVTAQAVVRAIPGL